MKMNLPNTPAGPPNPDALLAARRREVENALLTQALCGRKPSAAVLAQLRRYESGELSREVAFAGLYRGARERPCATAGHTRATPREALALLGYALRMGRE